MQMMDKEDYKLLSLQHTQIMSELRKSNMAFDELLSKTPIENIKQAFYELKEFKLDKIGDTDDTKKD